MEKEKIQQILKDKSNSDFNIDLSDLTKKFPYCNTFNLIQITSESRKNQFGFDEYLENNAHKIIDREILKSYVQGESDLIKDSTQNLEEVLETKIETETKEAIVEEEKTIEEEVSIPNDKQEIKSIQKEEKTEITPLEFDIANEAISSSIQLHVDELSEQQSETIEFIQEETQAEEKTTSSVDETVENSITEETEQVDLEIKDSEPKSFIDWLKVNRTNETSKSTIKTNEAIDSVDPETQSQEEEQISSNRKEELLNQFIATEPRISKPKKEFYSPTKSAKRSIEDNGEIITETLAKIYELQKNYSKAIESYEKLSLLYPEKSAFFASRIEKIKEKQNI